MAAPDDKAVTSLYCGRAGRIVTSVRGACSACGGPAREGDGRHRPVTPRLLKRLGYVTTPLPDAAAPVVATRRVLCVDNHASRNLAVFLLRRAGFEVSTADDALTVLEAARVGGFDLYLVNHKLLHGAGGEFYDRLRMAAGRAPILFYSTVTYPFRRRATGRGAGGPSEPVSVTEVAVAAEEALGERTRAGTAVETHATGGARRRGWSGVAKVLAGASGLLAAALLLRSLAQAQRTTSGRAAP